MKNTIIRILSIAAVVSMATFPVLNVDAKNTSAVKTIKFEVKPFLDFERKFTKVDIVMDKSEYTKREKANASQSGLSRQLIARERTDEPSVSYDLASLRKLYADASAKYGIDWRLLEAVHQVETGKSSSTCRKSYAGATGPFQFIPSTFRHYSDGGDICDLKDAMYAAANLLSSGGADRGDIDSALFNYNHSMAYVEKVKSVMNSI